MVNALDSTPLSDAASAEPGGDGVAVGDLSWPAASVPFGTDYLVVTRYILRVKGVLRSLADKKCSNRSQNFEDPGTVIFTPSINDANPSLETDELEFIETVEVMRMRPMLPDEFCIR